MSRIFTFFLILTTHLTAAYNPFFDEKAEPQIQQQIVSKQEKATETKEVFQTVYFGFIETQNKKLALIEFNKKHIVVKQGDKVFTKDNEFTVYSINSNYIILKDSYGKIQQIYFSGKKDNSWRNNAYNLNNRVVTQ